MGKEDKSKKTPKKVKKTTIKLGQIEQIVSRASGIVRKELPIKTSYRLSKLFKKLEGEYTIFSEKRQELQQKYGKRDEKGELVIKETGAGRVVDLQEDKLAVFEKEFQELSNIEVEIEYIPFTLEDFGNINVSLADLYQMEMFIEDGE